MPDMCQLELGDPAATYRVGDPDPTPPVDELDYCDDSWLVPSTDAMYWCTWRTSEHLALGVPHVAGVEDRAGVCTIGATWTENGEGTELQGHAVTAAGAIVPPDGGV